MQDTDAPRFSLLAGDGSVDGNELAALYAYPDTLTTPWVRGNAIASLDGAATTAGTSGGLGGAGDRWLFAGQRELADVIVVGAGTARTENYGGARMSVAQRRRRQSRGQGEVPPIALVTRTGLVDRDIRVLTESETPPLVLTCAASIGAARERIGRGAEVIDCSGSDRSQVDLAVLLDQLGRRGLLRVLSEGGPSLMGAFVAQQLLDELCLTTAPLLVGGGAVRITSDGDDALTSMRRIHLLADNDGYLYSRHVRVR